MAELNAQNLVEGTANLSNGGRDIYFRRDVGSHLAILSASRAEPVGPFGAPQLAPAINAPSNETNPVVREDGLELWFSSDRGPGAGYRIHVATRPSRMDAFGAPVEVAELNTAGTSYFPAWVSPDGCVIWIASNRPGGAGGADLYRSVRGQ